MKKVMCLFLYLFIICLTCSCGGASSSGSGCENGVAGEYTVTFTDCPVGMLANSFSVTQSGSDLTFLAAGFKTLYGTIDSSCNISVSATYSTPSGNKTYSCTGTWSDGIADMTCDRIDLNTGTVNGTCAYRCKIFEPEIQDIAYLSLTEIDNWVNTTGTCNYTFDDIFCGSETSDVDNPFTYLVTLYITNAYYSIDGNINATDSSTYQFRDGNDNILGEVAYNSTGTINFTSGDITCEGALGMNIFDQFDFYGAQCSDSQSNTCKICYDVTN